MTKKPIFFLMFILAVYSAAACDFSPNSKNTADFLNEVSDLNSKLSGCPVPLNGAAKAAFGSSQKVQLTINRNDGTTSYVLFSISGGNLAAVSLGSGSPGYEIFMDECTFDTVLKNGFGAFSYLYLQGKIKVVPKGFWNKLKFNVAKAFATGILKKSAVEVKSECQKENGAVCQHGGECSSGNCVGDGQGPPWTYRCSCDPSKYMASCPAETAPAANPSGLRPAGELCEHGGQCETGNCVGVGQGPPWTYRCSCNAFKYETGC